MFSVAVYGKLSAWASETAGTQGSSHGLLYPDRQQNPNRPEPFHIQADSGANGSATCPRSASKPGARTCFPLLFTENCPLGLQKLRALKDLSTAFFIRTASKIQTGLNHSTSKRTVAQTAAPHVRGPPPNPERGHVFRCCLRKTVRLGFRNCGHSRIFPRPALSG